MENYTLQTEDLNPQPELNHSDKIAGIFSSPASTFNIISKFPAKTVDWLIPIIVLAAISVVVAFLKFNNPQIKEAMLSDQRAKTEQSLNEKVKQGKLSQEEADKQLEKSEEIMNSPLMVIFGIIGSIVSVFFFTFLFAAIYYVAGRFILKGTGTYTDTLVAVGLSQYIGVISVIAATILSIVKGAAINDASLASIIGMPHSSPFYIPASLIDILSIWSLIVLIIGLTKMFKLKNLTGFAIVTIVIWIGMKIVAFSFVK